MKNFYFIRHAQSEANKAGIMCGGGVDTPLSDQGIEQAHRAHDILQRTDFPVMPDRLIHTGMQRTRATADIINQGLKLPLHQEERLKEHCVGQWEGKPWHAIEHDFTHFIDPPAGETQHIFSTRVKLGFETSLQHFSVPFIVAHGGVWIALMRLFDKNKLYLMDNAIPHYCVYDANKSGFPWHVYRINAQSMTLIKEI